MRSPHSTIPDVRVTTTPAGHVVTCSACAFNEKRSLRWSADTIAVEHRKSHGGWR